MAVSVVGNAASGASKPTTSRRRQQRGRLVRGDHDPVCSWGRMSGTSCGESGGEGPREHETHRDRVTRGSGRSRRATSTDVSLRHLIEESQRGRGSIHGDSALREGNTTRRSSRPIVITPTRRDIAGRHRRHGQPVRRAARGSSVRHRRDHPICRPSEDHEQCRHRLAGRRGRPRRAGNEHRRHGSRQPGHAMTPPERPATTRGCR